MGLFDQLGVNVEDLPETGFTKPKDGYHNFEITEVTKRNGTKNEPNVTKLTIEYDLEEAGSATEWFTIAEDGDSSTDKAQKSLGFLRDRLKDLGIDPNEFDPDEGQLIGIKGSLQLVTNKAGFQNVRNVEVEDLPDSDEVSEDPTDYDDGSKEQDAAIKKKVAANRAARQAPAKAAPAKKAPAKPKPADDDEDNPFE